MMSGVGCVCGSTLKCRTVDICEFFFFKQKTAYEMRISDLSSDVCSSDLRAGNDRLRGDDRGQRCEHQRRDQQHFRKHAEERIVSRFRMREQQGALTDRKSVV